MPIGISNHYAIAAIQGALAQGIDKSTLFMRAGINEKQLSDPSGTITPQQLSVLYKVLWVLLKDEFFGLGKTPCKLGFFRLLASNHPRMENLRSVLEYSAIFFQTTRDDVQFATEVNGDDAKLIITIDCAETDKDCFVREYHLIGWQRYLSWLIGYRLEPTETGLNFPETDHSDLYRFYFDGEYKFDQPTCHIVFDKKFLDYPIVRSHGELQSYLDSLPLPVFYQPGMKQKYTSLVEGVIQNYPLTELPSLDQVAESLEIQKRTLHRKLIGENTNFRQIVNDYRTNHAVELLTKQGLAVNEVSIALGFSEPAAFCHFFKRQAGLSPSQYAQFNEKHVLKI